MDANSSREIREIDRRILRQRALELAKPAADRGVLPMLEILQFIAGGRRFGIESKYVCEVRGAEGLAALPGVPAFVSGILNIRGQIWSAVDLRRLLRLEGQDAEAPGGKAILIAAGEMEFALLADAVDELRGIDPETLNFTMAGMKAEARPYLLGIYGDGRMILDGHKLLSDPDLVVNQ